MPEDVMVHLIKEGGRAYYDDTPRYKNPYSGVSGEFWFEGWDQANSVHDLFTQNQALEAQNKELCEDNKALTNQNEELSRTRANLIMFLGELKLYTEQRRWFQFSREKIIQDIDYTLEHLEVPD
jgi:hypothetical protein